MAAIVALSLLALMGMVVLVVDLGAMLVLRRRLVTAADAGSLAAAQSCAVGAVAEAPGKALELAAANQPSLEQFRYTVEPAGACGLAPGSVTVGYRSEQRLYFAPILGLGSEGTVRAQATALWAPPRIADPVPVMFDSEWLTTVCGFPAEPPASRDDEAECAFLYDNDQIGSSTWGLLNPNLWDVGSGEHCTNTEGARGVRDVIEAGGLEGAPLNWPAPTYVCAMNGLEASSWMALDDQEGKILFFPVVDSSGQIPPPPEKPDKVNVVAYIALRVKNVSKVHQGPDVFGACDGDYAIPVSSGDVLDLETISGQMGCATPPLKSISDLELASLDAGEPFREGSDYELDPQEEVVTWTDGSQPGLRISFTWTKAGQKTCGEQVTGNASAVCAIVTWPGPQLGGTDPIEHTSNPLDFGLRAVRLER